MAIKPTKINIWNAFDEFGILAGLAHWSEDGKTLTNVRYPGETNKLLKDRIITANKYRGNSTIQGLINNISRDLSISVSGTANNQIKFIILKLNDSFICRNHLIPVLLVFEYLCLLLVVGLHLMKLDLK